MNINFDRSRKGYNDEWGDSDGILLRDRQPLKPYKSVFGAKKGVPKASDVKLYYSDSSEFIVASIKKTIGLETFKGFIAGVAEAECSFSSQGYLDSAYIGLDTSNTKVPGVGQSRNVHPEILQYARVVATAQRGTRLAIGFPTVVKENFKGERWDLHAVASYILTQMARVVKIDKIDNEAHLIATFVWAVNHWRGVDQNISLYVAKMEKYTGYNVRKVLRQFIKNTGQEAITSDDKKLLSKMNKNFF